ncbi:hypothetical protein PGH45_19075 [Legionella pneumophila]|nr:hypothetical protein [Legionella pneumophila]
MKAKARARAKSLNANNNPVQSFINPSIREEAAEWQFVHDHASKANCTFYLPFIMSFFIQLATTNVSMLPRQLQVLGKWVLH